MLRPAILLVVIPLAFAATAAAQQPARLDTTRVYELDAVVVTADRAAGRLASSTAAVSVLRGEVLEQRPARTLADVLEQTPGFAFLRLDGLGYAPQASVRGFYGGGEAEYVVVLLDGRPVNDLASGLVGWTELPMVGVEAVEVLRGGASSLYGDAAIGGVINLVTDRSGAPGGRLRLAGGSYGAFSGAASAQGRLGGRRATAYADAQRTDGFRDHAERVFANVGASVALLDGARTLTLSTRHHVSMADEPGPLRAAVAEDDPTVTSPFFRFDEAEERTHRLALDGTAALGERVAVEGALTGELRHADAIRTIPLSPDFADTKNRVLDARRLLGTAQMTVGGLPLSGRLVAGVDASTGALDSRYFQFVTGGQEDYQQATGTRGPLDAEGTATRRAGAAFAQLDLQPTPRLRLSLGARLDALRDAFEPEAGGEETTATHSAFSPKAGANLRYVQTARHAGHVYANVGRSFKAPTLDQLFDRRTFPVPFPPFAVTISNAELVPQTGVHLEAGFYHRAEIAPRLAAELSVAVYQIDMEDELDFSFEEFRTVNIAESRHRGVEAGLTLYLGEGVTAFGNYTLQNVTAENGPNEGNYVKAIPRDFVSAGLSARHRSGVGGAVTLRSAQRIVLDDANTIRLPGYTTVDARVSYRFAPLTLGLEAFNLFDAEYSTTGFPDPSGAEVVYLYPAAGRALRLALSVAI
ncbi:MAG: TonB-dependent receptor [Rhodothermales bacterium]|nr:TonB-dependent receptor [Rhodothermales bacterium]